MRLVLGGLVGLALLLLAFLNQKFVADHLTDELLGATLRLISDLGHALLVPMDG